MGAVNFSLDRHLVEALQSALPLEVLVETGTFEGDTLASLGDRFAALHSIELSPEYFAAAQARFAGDSRISLYQGDSAEKLRQVRATLPADGVLYFLDAHWCVATNTAGEASQCPLLDEIAAIGSLGTGSVIVIDDARLFLAPPPAPHEISQWPSFEQVSRALRGVGPEHQMMVVNDLILFYPEPATAAVSRFAAEHGVDWLQVMSKIRDYDNLRDQFDGLQGQFDGLQDQFDGLLLQLERVQNEFDSLNLQLEDTARQGREKDAENESLRRTAEDRLGLINYQAHALRWHYPWRLMNLLGRHWGPLKAHLIAGFRPMLGVLRQHPPRLAILPGPYQSSYPAEQLPKVSIVTPSYNQAIYLGRTIDSVLNQGYPNLEYVVQDGASKDGSREVLEAYSDRLTHWESVPDNGQTHAINLGFRHVSGDILAYLNSDDVLLPGALHYVAEYFLRHPEVEAVYGHRLIIDEQDREIGRWVMPPHDAEVLTWADFVPQETLFWRRSAWERIGSQLDESFHFAMDWDLLLRLQAAGVKMVRLPRFLGGFRVHPQQKTLVEISDTGFKEMNRLRERCHGRAVTHLEVTKGVAAYLSKQVLYNWAEKISRWMGLA